MQAIHEGDWKRAEQIAREHLQEAPDDPNWLTPLAVALQMQRRWEETVNVVEHAIRHRAELTRADRDQPRLAGMLVRARRAARLPRPDFEDLSFEFWKSDAHFADSFSRTKQASAASGRITDQEAAALQRLVDESTWIDAMASGGSFLALVAAAAPGDSRTTMDGILMDLCADAIGPSQEMPPVKSDLVPISEARAALSDGALLDWSVDDLLDEAWDCYREDLDWQLENRITEGPRLIEILKRYGYGLNRVRDDIRDGMALSHMLFEQTTFPRSIIVRERGLRCEISLFGSHFEAADAPTAIRSIAAAVERCPQGWDVAIRTLERHLSMTEYEASAIPPWKRTWE
jgi:hypothetical protein